MQLRTSVEPAITIGGVAKASVITSECPLVANASKDNQVGSDIITVPDVDFRQRALWRPLGATNCPFSDRHDALLFGEKVGAASFCRF